MLSSKVRSPIYHCFGFTDISRTEKAALGISYDTNIMESLQRAIGGVFQELIMSSNPKNSEVLFVGTACLGVVTLKTIQRAQSVSVCYQPPASYFQ